MVFPLREVISSKLKLFATGGQFGDGEQYQMENDDGSRWKHSLCTMAFFPGSAAGAAALKSGDASPCSVGS